MLRETALLTSEGLEGRSERPATGHGQPRAAAMDSHRMKTCATGEHRGRSTAGRPVLHLRCRTGLPIPTGRSGAIRPSGWSDSPQWVERFAPPPMASMAVRKLVAPTENHVLGRNTWLFVLFRRIAVTGTGLAWSSWSRISIPCLLKSGFFKTALSRCRLFKEMFS